MYLIISFSPCRDFSKFCVFLSISQFWLVFTMVVYEKIFFEPYTNDQYIWHRNNIAQLCFILRTAKLHWNFSSWLRDASDIYRFPTVHMAKTHFLSENLWISKPSLSLVEKCQCSSAVPNIKYNYIILFLCEMYWSFVYALKYIFS